MTIDKEVSRSFWSRRASSPSNRWTPDAMREWEYAEIIRRSPSPKHILDLGSGHGELSRKLASDKVLLTAVDWEPAFGEAFQGKNHEFIVSSVANFKVKRQFDLILLMGVVTCIDHADEIEVYSSLSSMHDENGIVIIKNQCAVGSEFIFNGFSEALGERYTGRYPNIDKQMQDIGRFFVNVEVVKYPSEFNKWDNSMHVMFIASGHHE